MKEYLSKLEWTIVAGDPPHGTDQIPVFEMHDSDKMLEKAVKVVKRLIYWHIKKNIFY